MRPDPRSAVALPEAVGEIQQRGDLEIRRQEIVRVPAAAAIDPCRGQSRAPCSVGVPRMGRHKHGVRGVDFAGPQRVGVGARSRLPDPGLLDGQAGLEGVLQFCVAATSVQSMPTRC